MHVPDLAYPPNCSDPIFGGSSIARLFKCHSIKKVTMYLQHKKNEHDHMSCNVPTIISEGICKAKKKKKSVLDS